MMYDDIANNKENPKKGEVTFEKEKKNTFFSVPFTYIHSEYNTLCFFSF